MTRFDAAAMAAAISTLKCTKMYGTVSMNVDMMNLPNLASYDLTSMRTTMATSFGIFLTEEVVENWRRVTEGGVIVEAAYGLSETHTGDTFSPLDKPRIGSVGIPHSGTDLKIVDFDDPHVELEPGQVGEITVKSPAVFKGYWEREDATKEALREGRLYTGDMGKFDEDGYCPSSGEERNDQGLGLRHCSGRGGGLHDAPPRGETSRLHTYSRPEERRVRQGIHRFEPGLRGQDFGAGTHRLGAGKMAAYKYPRVIEFRYDIPKSTVREDLEKDIERGGDEQGPVRASLVVRRPSLIGVMQKGWSERNSELSREVVMSEKKKVAKGGSFSIDRRDFMKKTVALTTGTLGASLFSPLGKPFLFAQTKEPIKVGYCEVLSGLFGSIGSRGGYGSKAGGRKTSTHRVELWAAR